MSGPPMLRADLLAARIYERLVTEPAHGFMPAERAASIAFNNAAAFAVEAARRDPHTGARVHEGLPAESEPLAAAEVPA